MKKAIVLAALFLTGCASQMSGEAAQDRSMAKVTKACQRLVFAQQSLPTKMKQCQKMMKGDMMKRCEAIVNAEDKNETTMETCKADMLQNRSSLATPFPGSTWSPT